MTVESGKTLSLYFNTFSTEKLSQQELADKIGINQANISRALSGESLLNLEATERAMEVLQVPQSFRAEFLLYMVGYPKSLVTTVLKPNKQKVSSLIENNK